MQIRMSEEAQKILWIQIIDLLSEVEPGDLKEFNELKAEHDSARKAEKSFKVALKKVSEYTGRLEKENAGLKLEIRRLNDLNVC